MTTLMICGDTRTANRTLINRAVNQAETDQVIILTPSTTPGTLRSPTPDTGARRQIPIPPDPEATAAMLLETQPDAVALIYPRLQPPSPEALTVVSQAQELGIPVSAHYPKVVLVTGGPRFDNRATIAHVLDQEDPTRIVVAATGATSQAVQEYARNRGIPLDRPPEQEADDPDEDDLQQAPPTGEDMLRRSSPDLVVAFPGDRDARNLHQSASAQGYQVNQVYAVSNEPEQETRPMSTRVHQAPRKQRPRPAGKTARPRPDIDPTKGAIARRLYELTR